MTGDLQELAELRRAIDSARKEEAQALRDAALLANSKAGKEAIGAAMAKCASAREQKNQLVQRLIGVVERERPLG